MATTMYPKKKSEYRLHIRHIHSAHHSRYRDESDSGDRGANHSKRDYNTKVIGSLP